MSVQYFTNNVVLILTFVPRIKFDIDSYSKLKGKVSKYRGSVVITKKDFSLKLTKNGYCYVFLKNNFKLYFEEIENFISSLSSIFLLSFSIGNYDIIKVKLLNIHLSLEINLKKSELKIIELFKKLYYNLQDTFQFKLKESNSYESIWLNYDERKEINSLTYISGIRLTNRDITLTLGHNFKGNCIVKDWSSFLFLCSEIKKIITDISREKELSYQEKK